LFPSDSRKLLKTPRQINVIEVSGGQLYHFGIPKYITEVLTHGFKPLDFSKLHSTLNPERLITLKIGIDGIPISKSSNVQFWPILGSVDQAMMKNVFIISLFFGSTKPTNVTEILNPFISEMKLLESQGITINNNNFDVRISCIIADAPARSFIKSIKNHNAYYGCERCCQKGKWKKRVIYPNKTCELYTDDTFLNQLYPNHHDGALPLTELKIGIP
jgi:hypothetical protein